MEQIYMDAKKEHEKELKVLFRYGIVCLFFLFAGLALLILGAVPFNESNLNAISVINNIIKLYTINRGNTYEVLFGAGISIFYIIILVKYIKGIVYVWKKAAAITFPDIEKPKKFVLHIYREGGKIFASILALFIVSLLIYQYDLTILSIIYLVLIIGYVVTKEIIMLFIADKEEKPQSEKTEEQVKEIIEDENTEKPKSKKIKPEVLDFILNVSCSVILLLIVIIIILQVLQSSIFSLSNDLGIGFKAITLRNIGSIKYTYFIYHYIFRDIMHIALVIQALAIAQNLIEKTSNYFVLIRKGVIAMLVFTIVYMLVNTYFEKQLVYGNVYFDLNMLKEMLSVSVHTFIPIIIALTAALILLLSPLCYKKKISKPHFYSREY